jgi:hypothetical protein
MRLPEPRTFLSAALFFLCVALPAAPDPPAADVAAFRILFIGNSLTYTNDLPAIVAALAQAGGAPLPVTRALVDGGASLEDHWKRGRARQAIAEGRWNFVILQQGPSAMPESRMLLIQYTRLFAAEIRKAGAAPVLYMVWPSTDRRQDFRGVSDSYRQAAKEVDAILCPVGDAWQDAWKRDPAIDLYSADGLHPTPAGSYLAGLVIYLQLYGKSPIGLPSDLKLPSGVELPVPLEQANALQQVASEIVARRGKP